MCGIFAYLSSTTGDIEKLKEHGMKSKHRGPDKTKDICIHGDNSFVYFLFHRLAIKGLNEKSDQPMKLKKNDIEKITAAVDESSKKLNSLERQIRVYTRKLNTIDTGSMTIGNRVANAIRDLPVIDFLNPYLKINQIIIPDITASVAFN